MTLIDLDILTTGDLGLDNGDLVLVRGLDAVRQRVLTRMTTQLGEWAFDTELGLDYFGEVLRKDVNVGLVRSRILALVAAAPGVLQVRFLDVDFDRPARTLSVQYIFLVDPDFLTDSERADLGLESNTVEASGTLSVDVDSGELNFLLSSIGPIL